MRKFCIFSSFVVLLTVYALNFQPAVARADWDPSQPAKYVQMPDVEQGMDVNATWLVDVSQPIERLQPIPPYWKVLADDFPCFLAGPITDIHIWGSWLNDQFNTEGTPSPAVNLNAKFKLSIHKDVPAGVDAPYSHPGEQLWSQIFDPTQYKMQQWGGPTSEVFYDPNTNEIIGSDTRIWQYNFFINPAEAFLQAGPDATGKPSIYWLDVQAIVPWTPGTPQTIFGWKTTRPIPTGSLLGDDAVFADTPTPGGDPSGPGTLQGVPWVDMHYPGGPYQGLSIDMAFAITPEPSTVLMLLGACLFGLAAYIRRR